MTADTYVLQTVAEQDIRAAYAIHKAAVTNHWSYSTFADCVSQPYTLLVSKSEIQVIGYAIILTVADEATLMDIALVPEMRGHGRGKILLHAVTDHCEKNGASSIWLEVRASNHVAQNLYHSFSFQTVEVRKNYYITGATKEDAVIMQRILKDTK
ncbi:ribosomal protein S18-alanine N-acetyltransferase [Alteromonas ponticola]|uniref:[Ribosomal protein bS18]-alanine N-acetyltransferase n=1 Tax=Alteromonas aquimaris TaxID=2998417 RepID=A0ABT3P6J3_9ALTE|nr:ribosomal protein S18-alanine N-acetyltransferase [Alteromonas aquimaris]MCW8107701.1 ribosomal protein S18-alanine N-acetyltransferase [Alteromonas aquimaris]